jgi:hypothetical protein
MADHVLVIEHNRPIPKVAGRGRPKGSGCNLKTLAKLKPGDSLFDVPRNKMNSIRSSAYRAGVEISIRLIPDTQLYSIWRLA